MKILRSFLEVTGVAAFFLIFVVAGASDTNTMSISQIAILGFSCLGYILFAIVVHKNAPKVVRHLKRAIRKLSI